MSDPTAPVTRDRETLRERLRGELDHLLVDAHGVPEAERDEWAARLARAATPPRPTGTDLAATSDPTALREAAEALVIFAGRFSAGDSDVQREDLQVAIDAVRDALAAPPAAPSEDAADTYSAAKRLALVSDLIDVIAPVHLEQAATAPRPDDCIYRFGAKETIEAAIRAAAGDPHICANHDESLDEAYRKGLADGEDRWRTLGSSVADHEPVYYGGFTTPGCCVYHASRLRAAAGDGGLDVERALREALADIRVGTTTGITDHRIERIVRDADYALAALERGDTKNALAALRRGFQRAPVALRAALAHTESATDRSGEASDPLDGFVAAASRAMRERLDHGARKFGRLSWRQHYLDTDNRDRLRRAVTHLVAARKNSADPAEWAKRAADVANQAFMYADPERRP